jgi:hypothetical protein
MKILRTKSVIVGIFLFLLPFRCNPEIERGRIRERKMKRISLFLGFVLTGLLVVSAASIPLQAAIPASERAALIALYNATNGDNWLDNSGWKGNNNEPDGFSQIGSEGSWFGITVSGDHVTMISFWENHLNGGIPSVLENLSNLGWLVLNYNQLSGSIPLELGNLSSLKYVSISSNQFTGNIPSSLTNLINLLLLEIRHNCLYTNNPDLRRWLNGFDPNWESYQCEGEREPPFGSFDTPIDGSTICSSIPVTGWALDDTGIDSVKIYREQGKDLVYIGDVVFVEGARPDVFAAYPGYPNNIKAGWGYMMLTNLLPNSGNGPFVLHAIATDVVGKTTTLGTKTIHCDNANAVKPFGAIDTPTQGGSASGSSFINWGWVLTPQPNSIPTDGSTIDVFVDGVNIGHPTYNNYRKDIADLFPGYANSNGAIGYFYLDTTVYENGVHTIQWTASDNASNTDGIGSRYFTIHNTAEHLAQHAWRPDSREQACLFQDSIRDIPLDYSSPILVKKGFVKDVEPGEISPDNEGLIKIEINELERLVIQFSESNVDMDLESYSSDCLTRKSTPPYRYSGYLQLGSTLKSLPVGSTLDSARGVFYWQPGPGLIGEYRFVFIEKGQDMDMSRSNIIVKIVPRFDK